jgi:phosphohistidine phosphatase
MGTRRLILFRHAKSDWESDAASDFDRPLGERGRRDAPRMGRWMQFNGLVPDRVCCSSSARTRETLELLGTELDLAGSEIIFLGDLYLANEIEIAEVAAENLRTGNCVMLVGHNPGFEMALLHYCPDVAVPEDGKLMPTATAAVIDIPQNGEPELRFLQRPRDL